MAATRFFDSATPISYSTLNTFGGLSRTVKALPSGEPLHYAMLKAQNSRKYSKSTNSGVSLNAIFSSYSRQIFLKFSQSLADMQHSRLRKKIKNLTTGFREQVGQSSETKMLISPPNGGRFPRNKNCFCQGPWAHNMQGSDRGWGPPKGVNSKMHPPPQNFKSNFLENEFVNFFQIFYGRRGTQYLPCGTV